MPQLVFENADAAWICRRQGDWPAAAAVSGVIDQEDRYVVLRHMFVQQRIDTAAACARDAVVLGYARDDKTCLKIGVTGLGAWIGRRGRDDVVRAGLVRGDLDAVDIASYSLTSSSGIVVSFGNNFVINGLLIGTHTVTWTVTDECGNSSTCSFEITVVDDVVPVANCDLHTIVSLTNDGPNGITLVPASVFDDGSYDNCGPVTTSATAASRASTRATPASSP